MEAVLIQALNRLEAILVGETSALRENRRINLAETSTRKNQSLLELSRISRGVDESQMSPELRDRLSTVKSRLEDNSNIIRLHMEATKEISAVLLRALADADSDGTYDSSIRGAKREL